MAKEKTYFGKEASTKTSAAPKAKRAYTRRARTAGRKTNSDLITIQIPSAAGYAVGQFVASWQQQQQA